VAIVGRDRPHACTRAAFRGMASGKTALGQPHANAPSANKLEPTIPRNDNHNGCRVII
jgi:hypothetical protein